MASDVHKTVDFDYRTFLAKVNDADTERREVFERLIKQMESSQSELRNVSHDLESERSARRGLQEEVSRLKALTNRSGFIAVLLDADADDYVFKANFLDKNEHGGKEAADELFARVREYVTSLGLGDESTEIVVRAYANLKDLRIACIKYGKMKQDGNLNVFAQSFSHRRPLFDFVDVGKGKEEADNKIRQNLEFFINNAQCKHVILGVCHDTGYRPVLNALASDSSTRDRITLLEGNPVNFNLRDLGFTRPPLRLSSVFSPIVKTLPVKPSTFTNPAGYSTTAAAVTKASEIGIPIKLGHVGGTLINNHAMSHLLMPTFDANRMRIDTPINVNPNWPYLKTLEKSNLCGYYYLRGECDGKCGRSHERSPLDELGFRCLWFIMRRGLCYSARKNKICTDVRCIYGHSRTAEGGYV